MMTAVVMCLSGSGVFSASYRTNHTIWNSLSFELSGPASMAELVALTLKASGFLSISHF
jgi:hypothetical protein